MGRLNNRKFISQRGAHASQPQGDTQVTTGWGIKPGHASRRTITWYPLAVLAFPVTSTHDKMSLMTSVSGKLSFVFGGGLTSREKTGTETGCRRSISGCRKRLSTCPPHFALSPRECTPGVCRVVCPTEATQPCPSPKGAGFSVATTPPAQRAHLNQEGSCVKSLEPGNIKFLFSWAEGHSTNEVYMLSQGAMERHIFKWCCPARERNRERGHSEHVPAVQGAPREYERRHGHGNGSSRGRRVSCLLFGAAVMERS